MKILYIGQYSKGTTSKMRADEISKIINPAQFDIIDTHVPFFKTNRLFRTIGFRYKFGPLIYKINNYILKNLKSNSYDLIWVDKGVFITKSTIEILRKQTDKLVHYTPDMAFYENKSAYFNSSMNLYDYLVTTKLAEIDTYLRHVSKEKLLVTTQGYSKNIHKPTHAFNQKDDSVVFIGLAEPHRLEIAELLLKNGINLKLVGKNWEGFLAKNSKSKNLKYLGEAVYDKAYSELISSSRFSLGLLSKRFNEYHTTRTFEIPACGTALLTEKNIETQKIYSDDEVIFYDDNIDLVKKIVYYNKNSEKLEELIIKGYERVKMGGYDYNSILKKIIEKVTL
ncbi:glycosyltransferase family protein [Winogradskyella pacifica]|uniref:glycosyltransferase family protein n=1 Tax=Winogradskyella pacifica TaxID=664642 RepID=UPI0015C9D967|nr:glycosyltransferase [Winogradskyella pacifica]